MAKKADPFYKDRKGEWRWRAVARNGRKVADPGEGYKTRAGARNGARAAARLLAALFLPPVAP